MALPRLQMVSGLLAFALAACGTAVPRIEEIWDDDTGAAHTLEMKVKRKIFCELQDAVASVASKDAVDAYVDGKKVVTAKAIPADWGVTMVITMTVEEGSAFNPGLTLNTPMIPAATRFPGDILVAGDQSYNFGLGGRASTTATRTDKFTFFYLVKDLKDYQHGCSQEIAEDLHGSSFLLESQLGIKKWLGNAANVRNSVGMSSSEDPSDEGVMSYNIKFNIVSGGSVTPTWSLVRVSTSYPSSVLFDASRNRTHELLLTFGPTVPSSKKGGKRVPGVLATNDSLSQQIGSAVRTGVINALQR